MDNMNFDFLKSYKIDLVYLNNWVVLFLCNFQTCFRDDYMTAEQWYMVVIYIPITCLQLQWIFDGVWFIWSVIQSSKLFLSFYDKIIFQVF